MHNIINRAAAAAKDDHYAPSMSVDTASASIISSNNSQRFSDLTSSAISNDPLTNGHDFDHFDHFDIIDDLDYDDIDDGLIVDQELSHQQREGLIQELYDSEKKYLDTLEIVLNSYILPIRKNSKSSSLNFLGLKKPPCTEREMKWLFGNFEELLQVHVDNLLSLDERLSIWGPTQIISDVVQTWIPRIQQQYHLYFENYDVSVTTYERLTRFQPFKKFTESVNKTAKIKDTSLLSLLQTPVTCIQRYKKIISALVDATSPLHPDYNGLMQCKQRVQSLYEEFKPKIEDARNVDRVYQIQIAMTGQPFGVKAERRLFLQNDFSRATRQSDEDKTYFLFSDLLVFAKQKQNALQYKGHIPLERAKVRALPNDEDWSIEITCPFQGVDSLNSTFVGSSSTHIIKTLSEQDQSRWLRCMEIVIARLDKTQHNKIMINRKKQVAGSTSDSSRRQGTTISSGSTKSISNASI